MPGKRLRVAFHQHGIFGRQGNVDVVVEVEAIGLGGKFHGFDNAFVERIFDAGAGLRPR